ncbi:MAG: hypothetical protein ACRCTZ_23965 [Sarcina sp.]
MENILIFLIGSLAIYDFSLVFNLVHLLILGAFAINLAMIYKFIKNIGKLIL